MHNGLLDQIRTPAPQTALHQALHHARTEQWQLAHDALGAALADPAQARDAHLLLWEVCQALRDPDTACLHLAEALQLNPLTARDWALARAPQRRVLALAAPGDFQANLPVNMLLDRGRTELHTLWITDPAHLLADPRRAAALVPAGIDCVFVAIAQDARRNETLRAADALIASLGLPAINSGRAIATMSRIGAAQALQDVPGLVMPMPRAMTRKALAAEAASGRLAQAMIIRPETSHAGQGLERVASAGALLAYLARHPLESRFLTSPFIDYRSADGLWRKYRIVFVDGQPFPFHLAIHDDWAVWYYNAGMHRHPGRRREEARFLDAIEAAFPMPARQTLQEIGARIGLDYFGIDCALLPDGRLVVFEVETGMIVHDRDDEALFPYKKRCVPRIFQAVEAMIDRRIDARRLSATSRRAEAPRALETL